MSKSNKANPGSFRKTVIWSIFLIILCAVCGGALFYQYIKKGGLRARQTPSRVETLVARKLVAMSVPDDARRLMNPANASPNSADVEAGRDLYLRNCVICHAYDGSGRTAAGGGMYPPPLDLRAEALRGRNGSDGELFYFIQNGVRNTGMPGWQLPDQQIWQLVAYIRNLPKTDDVSGPPTNVDAPAMGTARYIGSATCAPCHQKIYDHWRKTPMANVVRDPREHPEAVAGDFSKSNTLVHFSVADVAFVYGSIWKQRYFKKVGDDYFPFPAQWDIRHKLWRPYVAKDDWWVADYPADNFKRPTGALCDGCHSVNYDIRTKQVTEWNVGCERCHGPGSEHVAHPTAKNIVNPMRQGYVAANDVCIQCHSQGRPRQNPIGGQYYDWPVGYEVTKNLIDFWRLEEHRVGDTTFTHFPDGTAHKNRMQGNDFITSVMYTHGVACSTCHDVHGTENYAQLRKPANVLCLDCHGPGSPNGPNAPTLEAHTHHKAGSPGSDCIDCHMPKIEQTIADVNVSSHTFHFVSPENAESMHMPNACNLCHKDKSVAWASKALKTWSNGSHWRLTD